MATQQGAVSPDTQTKEFWSNPKHFADLFNTAIFNGKEVLKAENLIEMDSNVSGVIESQGERFSLTRTRDIIRKVAHGTEFVILGVENQMEVHYAMPLRTMIYDGLGYLKEAKEIKHNHQVTKPKMTSGEFLGSFRKSDKLTPIITIVVYYGEEPWDGPHCLLDMMKDIPPEIKEVVSDYQMNLLQILHEDASKFQDKEIRQVMEYSQAFVTGDLKKAEALNQQDHVSKDTAYMIGSITKSEKLMTTLMEEEEVEEVDMCKLFQILMEDGRTEGIDRGRREMRWEAIQNIMDTFNLSMGEAMDALKIPEEEREQYMELV